jgi:hypothetical protein
VSGEATIALSLISHTNAGKTTLARTLLGRDVGEVRDAQHVTLQSSAYPLIGTDAGDALVLWDTPGFGDSARLARRLAQQGNPIGWFLTEVWDRFRDRAFWLAQQAVRNVRDEADVVLYLVNASEAPGDAGYLDAEMRVLAWIAKPVVVLLNQTGRPRPREEEQADETRWREALGSHATIRDVLTLDAFARCWVQEIALLDVVGRAIPESKLDAYRRLEAAWSARRVAQFEASIAALAVPIAAAACDREPLAESGAKSALRELGRSFGLGKEDTDGARQRAARALADRLEDALRIAMDRVIELHGFGGRAKADVLSRLSSRAALDAPVSEGKAALMGGVVSGALSGLAADLATGGLTLGAGVIAGALLGALGGAGVARGMNVVRGKSSAAVRWDDALLSELVASALLRYLAVAHYGRGRGDFAESEYPTFWPPLVARIVEARLARIDAVWAQREPACDAQRLEPAVREILEDAAREALETLYPCAR